MTPRAIATLAIAALAAAGCGEERGPGGRAAGTTPTPVAAGATTVGDAVAVVSVSLSDYALAPASPRIARHGVIAFVATNDGETTHALAVDSPTGEVSTKRLRPGEQGTLSLRLPPGTYKWLCPVADHERRGMVGRVRVAE
jgi:plastocyanin